MKDKTSLVDIFPEVATELNAEDLAQLKEYYESVNMLSDGSLNLEFNNRDQYHAAIVMSTIFDKADSIKLFSGNYNGDICDKSIYLEAIKRNFIDKGKNIEIIFEKDPVNSKAFKLLNDAIAHGKSNISIKLLDKDFSEKVRSVNKAKYLNHFVIGKPNMFRYEVDIDTYKAVCNFDDKNAYDTLETNFELLKSNSK